MLILSRRPNESLVIGESYVLAENIEITVLSVQGKQVRIGINAAEDITVLRKELYDKKVLENKADLSAND